MILRILIWFDIVVIFVTALTAAVYAAWFGATVLAVIGVVLASIGVAMIAGIRRQSPRILPPKLLIGALVPRAALFAWWGGNAGNALLGLLALPPTLALVVAAYARRRT